jgi:hypothetical protein
VGIERQGETQYLAAVAGKIDSNQTHTVIVPNGHRKTTDELQNNLREATMSSSGRNLNLVFPWIR